jgi:hypothetical protein
MDEEANSPFEPDFTREVFLVVRGDFFLLVTSLDQA